jgi:hypothetical protein
MTLLKRLRAFLKADVRLIRAGTYSHPRDVIHIKSIYIGPKATVHMAADQIIEVDNIYLRGCIVAYNTKSQFDLTSPIGSKL